MRISLTSVPPWFQNRFTSGTQPRHHRALFGGFFGSSRSQSSQSPWTDSARPQQSALLLPHDWKEETKTSKPGVLRANDSQRDSSPDLGEPSVLPQCHLPRFGRASCSGHVCLDIFSFISFLLGLRILPPSADSANGQTALGRVLRQFTSRLSNTGSSVQPRNWGKV